MIHDANCCLCEDCMDYRAAVIRRRARMGLRPIPQIPPVAATRDAAAGATNSTVSVGVGLHRGNDAPALDAHGPFPSLSSLESAASNPAMIATSGQSSSVAPVRVPEPQLARLGDTATLGPATHKERRSAGHPTGRRVTQGGAPCACVANAPAAQLPPCSEPASLGLGQMSSTAGETLPIPRDAAGAVLGQHLHGVHEAHGVSGLPAHAGRHVAASVATGVGAPTVGIAS